jgi:hypothetical protein
MPSLVPVMTRQRPHSIVAAVAAALAGLCSADLRGQIIIAGTYNGVTLSGDISIAAGTSATFTGGTTFTGANATFGNNAVLYWQQSGTLDGKALTLGSGARLQLSGTNNALTLDSATTLTGRVSVFSESSTGTAITNRGTLTHTSTASGSLYTGSFTNTGTITATAGSLHFGHTATGFNTANSGTVTASGSSTIVYIDGNVANTGTLRAESSGQLRFRGTNTTANLGTVELTLGGRAILAGTLNNTGATLAAPTGGVFELLGGTISGGTIAAGALTFTSSSGYLSGATLTGDLTLAASTYLRLTNGATFTGVNAALGNNAVVYWQQTGTLSGKALTLGSGSRIDVSGTNSSLTLDQTTSVTGAVRIYPSDGGSGTAIINHGTIAATNGGTLFASNFTNTGTITATAGSLQFGTTMTGYSTANSGTVTASGSSTIVYIDGNVANTGTLRAESSGQLRFRGTNTTANLGTVELTGNGRAYITGTFNNTGATLGAPTGGAFALLGGTVNGGTIAAGALTFTSSGGYLAGATLLGDLAIAAGAYVQFSGGTTFTGTNASLAGSATLYWRQAGGLDDKAVSFQPGGHIYTTGANNSFTFGATSTATGTVSIYASSEAGTAVTNLGTLTHTGGTGSLYARTFTNAGSITASAGTLYVGYPDATYVSTNTGTGAITASGSGTVNVRGSFANLGLLSATDSGVLLFTGTNTTANLGTVQLSSGGRARLNGTIANIGATLGALTGGSFELYGGTISGGSIATGALTFTNSGGNLSGTSLLGDLALAASTYVRFTGGTTFTGTNALFGNNASLHWEQAGVLDGKTLTFGSGAAVYVADTNNTFTLGPNSTATGSVSIYASGHTGTAVANHGTITHTAGTGYIYAPTFTNSGSITASGGALYLGYPNTYTSTNTSTGTITASGAGTTVYVRGDFANLGLLAADNSGVLVFHGVSSTANLGAVQLSTGGRARLNGLIENTGATLAAPTGGSFELFGATITGGTIAEGALTFTSSGGYLSGATLTGDLTLAASAYLRFTGAATFTGASASFGNNTGLYWEQIGALDGKALSFAPGAYVYTTGTNNTFTLGPTSTATGNITLYTSGHTGTAVTNHGTLTHTAGTGWIYAPTFTNSGSITASAGTLYLGSPNTYNSTNTSTGAITATGSGTTVYVRGNFANLGLLAAQDAGVLAFDGANTSANLGAVQLSSGGRARLSGTIDNTGATLAAPTGGSFELFGAMITGGTIAEGALTFTSSGGSLSGVTLTGDLTLAAGTYAGFTGGATFTGPSATFGAYAGIYWQQAGTLSGKALAFGSGGYVYLSGTNSSLTLDPATSVTGAVGIYSDSSSGTALHNLGTIAHTTGTGYLYARTFTNSGSITASAGSLTLGSASSGATFANEGGATIRVTGGASVYLQSPGTTQISNSGTIDVQSGTLYTGNRLTNTAGGIIRGAGTINGNVIFSGGTLAPGNSIGTLTFQSGTLTVTDAAVFAVELGGGMADRLVFQNPPAVVNLGAGLLTLSLTLLAPPADYTTYNLILISSGGSGIAGTFANLPVSGSMLSATFDGASYDFTINYETNLVSLDFTVIPEPSTYALLGLGAIVLAIAGRRSQRAKARDAGTC